MQAAKKLILASAIALTGTGLAQAATVIYANVEPPALRVETVPAPRVGYVWAPGYWGWHHHKSCGWKAATSMSAMATAIARHAGSMRATAGATTTAAGIADPASSATT